MLTAAILLAAAVAAKAPVTIAQCSMVVSGSYERAVQLRFRNTSPHVVKEVTFHIHNGKHSVDVTDRGTFAPHVEIDHTLTTPTWELYHGGASDCSVKAVQFEGGTIWNAPPHP